MTFRVFGFPKKKLEMVEMDERKCLLYHPGTPNLKLLGTVGMNPCMGLVLTGEVILESRIENGTLSLETLKFILLDHNSGISSTEKEQIQDNSENMEEVIDSFCTSVLQRILNEIEQKVENTYGENKLISINLENFYIIRCKQLIENKEPEEVLSANIQNQIANQLITLFYNKNKITEIGKDFEFPSVQFATNYKVDALEKNEMLNTQSCMDCLLQTDKNGQLQIMYRHVKLEHTLDKKNPKKRDASSQDIITPEPKKHKTKK